jgi:hypothetical protein
MTTMISDDDDELFEMVNLYPARTGLPMTVWVGPRGRARHAPRIKVCMAHGNRMDVHNTAVIGILPRPWLIAGSLSAADRDAVFAWVTLNTPALLDLWAGTIDGIGMGERQQRLTP